MRYKWILELWTYSSCEIEKESEKDGLNRGNTVSKARMKGKGKAESV